MSSRFSILCATLCILAATASSQVLTANDPVYGVGSITRDLTSGLDWLDLNPTVNRTVLDITAQLGVGGQFHGFRYASSSEVFQFFTDAGIPFIVTTPFTVTPSASNVPSVPNLMSQWGVTGFTGIPTVQPVSQAFVADGPGPTPPVYYTALLINSPGLGIASASTRGSSADNSTAFSHVGHALVRTTASSDTASTLVSQIEALAAGGTLTADQAAGLIDKLNALISSLDRGNSNSACGQANAFINQVEALVQSGNLLPVAGGQLITAATRIAGALGC